MIALRPHCSLAKKCTSSCASKSGRPQGVVIVVEPSDVVGCEMGRSRGLEPPTLGTTNRCSNQLSYDRHGDQGGVPFAAPPLKGGRRGTQGEAAPENSR